MKQRGYKEHPAGAIASGFFVAASSFIVLYFISVFFVIGPEGRPDDADRGGVAFDLCLVASAIVASWLGWLMKRYFDRQAGRR